MLSKQSQARPVADFNALNLLSHVCSASVAPVPLPTAPLYLAYPRAGDSVADYRPKRPAPDRTPLFEPIPADLAFPLTYQPLPSMLLHQYQSYPAYPAPMLAYAHEPTASLSLTHGPLLSIPDQASPFFFNQSVNQGFNLQQPQPCSLNQLYLGVPVAATPHSVAPANPPSELRPSDLAFAELIASVEAITQTKSSVTVDSKESTQPSQSPKRPSLSSDDEPALVAVEAVAERLFERHVLDQSQSTSLNGRAPNKIITYASLITMAILSVPDHRAKIGQIYSYIESRPELSAELPPNWKFSVRHNLSARSCFVKLADTSSATCRNSWWTIKPSELPASAKMVTRLLKL